MRRLFASAALLALFCSGASATSTIDTTQPVQGVPYNSAPIRQNFQNAAGDIGALQSMNAGATAPSAPVLGTLWLETPQNQTLYRLFIWNDRLTQWLQIATFDSLNNLWILNVGGGLPVTFLADDTTELGAQPNAVVTITGPGPIYSFGATAPAGVAKIIQFSGTTQIVYNATSMLIPGAADLNTVAGDVAIAVALGSGNWQILFLQSSTVLVQQGGTGRASLTNHAVLIGAGTSPVNFAGPGAAGLPLLGAGASADPAFGALNLAGAGVTGVLSVTAGGTGLSTIPAHALLIGANTSPPTTVLPGTTGFPLVAQGATIDPSYALLGVNGGGIGVTTLGAHGVMIGQAAAPVTTAMPGTAGYPLLSTGSGSDPAFGQLDLSGAGVTGTVPPSSVTDANNFLVNNSLTVTGVATFNGGAIFNNTAVFNTNASVAGSLQVAGNATFGGASVVAISGDLFAGGLTLSPAGNQPLCMNTGTGQVFFGSGGVCP